MRSAIHMIYIDISFKAFLSRNFFGLVSIEKPRQIYMVRPYLTFQCKGTVKLKNIKNNYFEIQNFKGAFMREGRLINRGVYFKMHKFRQQK